MYTATLVLMYCMYFADQGRSVYLIIYLIVFLFGVFRFDTWQFLRITIFSLLTYGLVIYLLVHLQTFRSHPEGRITPMDSPGRIIALFLLHRRVHQFAEE